MSKQCSKCSVVYENVELCFYKTKKNKSGFRSECKACTNARDNNYYSENKDKVKTRCSKYREENRDLINEKQKETRNSEDNKLNEYYKTRKTKFHERELLQGAKQRAKRKGLEFNIDVSDIIIPEICPLLQIPLATSEEKVSSNSPSLDRIDNSKGYVKGNVWVISHRANTIKSDLSKEEFIEFTRRLFTALGKNLEDIKAA